MKMKALAAAVALAFAGNASAAIYTDSDSGFQFGTGDAEMFLSVIDRGLTPTSYVLDLGISTDDFRLDDSLFVGVYADQSLLDFVANATGTLSWNVSGNSNAFGIDNDFTDIGLWP